MKEDKKENGNDDVNTEDTEGKQPEKRVCLDEPENKPVAEQNGTEESETVNEADDDDDDDVQEIKADIPVIDVADEEVAVQAEETEVADPEPAKETQSPAPATKTTPTRGRGGGRGRGMARRGRSSR